MLYVASHPEYPDEAFAICVDEPQWRAETAKTLAVWIKHGANVMRVDAKQGKEMIDRFMERRHKERL